MGRYLRRLAMRAGTQVLSPIPESPSTSPPPVSDADKGSQAVDDAETGVAQSDVSSRRSDDSPKSHRINVEESFVDHLMGLNEEYRHQLEATREELRLERAKNVKIMKDLEHYRVEYKNYKLSWTMDQAEINDLKARVQTLDTYKRQMNRMHNTITRLERENNKLKAPSFDAERKTPVVEETKAAVLPKMPSPPADGHLRRRPYTGKTRNEQTTSLPPISDNNKVVNVSQQTASSEKKGGKSPTHLPFPASFCPTPPTGPRKDAPSKRRSRIPLILPPVHGTSSVGSVLVDHQAKHESGRMSRGSVNTKSCHE